MTDLDLILAITGEDGVSWDYRPNVNVSPGTILPILDFQDGKYRIVPAPLPSVGQQVQAGTSISY